MTTSVRDYSPTFAREDHRTIGPIARSFRDIFPSRKGLTRICGSVVRHDRSPDLRPLIDPARLIDGHINAAVRASRATPPKGVLPGSTVEGVRTRPIGDPRNTLRAVRPIRSAAHVLCLVLEVNVVQTCHRLVARRTRHNCDRTMDHCRAFIGGDRIISEVNLKPFFAGSRLIHQFSAPSAISLRSYVAGVVS